MINSNLYSKCNNTALGNNFELTCKSKYSKNIALCNSFEASSNLIFSNNKAFVTVVR